MLWRSERLNDTSSSQNRNRSSSASDSSTARVSSWRPVSLIRSIFRAAVLSSMTTTGAEPQSVCPRSATVSAQTSARSSQESTYARMHATLGVLGDGEELHVGGCVERQVADEATRCLTPVLRGDRSNGARPLDGVPVGVLGVDRRPEGVLHPHDVVSGAQPTVT